MSRFIDSDEDYSGEGYPPVFRLRDRLDVLGVDTDYWLNRERVWDAESDDDWLPNEIPESVRKVYRDLASTFSQREWDDVDAALRKNPQLMSCQVLILTGDLLAEHGREADALSAYGLAVNLAPSPQAQLEIGYLIGLRGRARLPFSWRVESMPLVLLPNDEINFEGLSTYQVIYPELLQNLGFEFPQPSDLLRLALEAYGRVYGYYLSNADQDNDENVLARRKAEIAGHFTFRDDVWIQQLVVGDIGVLMHSLGEDPFDLVWNAFINWVDVTACWGPQVVDDRLQAWKTHIAGEELGRAKERQLYEAIRHLDEERRSTEVIRDPDKLVEKLEQAVARFGSVPRTTRAEIEQGWADLVGDTWASLLDGVRQQIIEGEWLRGVIEREDGSDYGAVALYYGKAIEALLCEITHSDRLLHQFGKMMTAQDANVLRFFRTGAPLEDLSSMLDKVARARNDASHTKRGAYRRTDPGTIQELREIIGGSGKREGLIPLLLKWRKP